MYEKIEGSGSVRILPFGTISISVIIPRPNTPEEEEPKQIKLLDGTTALTQIISSPPPELFA
jgi:hypothetical protein